MTSKNYGLDAKIYEETPILLRSVRGPETLCSQDGRTSTGRVIVVRAPRPPELEQDWDWTLSLSRNTFAPRLAQSGIAVFSRVVPGKEIQGQKPSKKRGIGGALELSGRISTIDLNDGGTQGGNRTDLSFGLNWYLSTTSVVKFNYIHSDVKDVGCSNILLLRYQFRPLPIPGWR